MKEFETVDAFVVQSKNATTIDELADSFQRAIGHFGFEAFALGPCSDIDDTLADAVVINRYPESWVRRYMEQRYFEIDPMLLHARREQLAFTWEAPSLREGMTKEQNLVLAEASEAGLKYGLCVPIHSWGRPPAVVSMAGRSAKIDSTVKSTMQLMAMYLHQSATRIVVGDGNASERLKKNAPYTSNTTVER